MESQPFHPITILGAGSWGTALALHLARLRQTVRVWSIETQEINAMRADRANNRYLPGFTLPENILPMTDLAEAVSGIDDIIIAIPSVGYRQTLNVLKPLLSKKARILTVSKGMDEISGYFLNEVAEDCLGKDFPFAVLSGPSFAREVAQGLPTAVMIASQNKSLISDMMLRFESKTFSTYPSTDVIGVEVGGVVKNVIAIATGLLDGMNLGVNARSALITLGLAEMIHLGQALGGHVETMIGLAGMGDLILTCSDNQSRNRRFGLALGQGLDILQAEHEIGQAIEGKRNSEIVIQLAKRLSIEMPICETVWHLLQGKLTPESAVHAMFKRKFKDTFFE